MKRFKTACVCIGICSAILAGCNEKTDKKQDSIKPAISATVAPEKTVEPEKTIAATSTPTPTENTTSYSKAITAKELESVEQQAKAYYKENISYELLSIAVAEDDNELYEANSEYQPGTIIVLKTETSHGGEGVYRYITYVRKNVNDQFELLGEGY